MCRRAAQGRSKARRNMPICMRRRGSQDSQQNMASPGHQWLDDHTRRLVKDITGLAGVEEVVLTVREDAPARLTTDQARGRSRRSLLRGRALPSAVLESPYMHVGMSNTPRVATLRCHPTGVVATASCVLHCHPKLRRHEVLLHCFRSAFKCMRCSCWRSLRTASSPWSGSTSTPWRSASSRPSSSPTPPPPGAWCAA